MRLSSRSAAKLYLQSSWRQLVFYGVVGVVATIILLQLLYPAQRLTPFATIENRAYGTQQKKAVVRDLNARYKKQHVALFFGDAKTPQQKTDFASFGLTVDTKNKLKNYTYPWYIRLIPTSLLWNHWRYHDTAPDYHRSASTREAFLDDLVGKDCTVTPTNATLRAASNELVVVPSKDGGECNRTEVTTALSQLKPRLSAGTKTVRLPIKATPAAITDDQARQLADTLMDRVGEGIDITAGKKTVQLPADKVYSWLRFTPKDDTISASVDPAKAKKYLTDSLERYVHKKAGVTKVTTRDFDEISRQAGASGRTLDQTKTAAALTDYINRSEDAVTAVTKKITPKVAYTRHYTKTSTGIAAKISHFTNDHKGVYGVAFEELGGKRRTAQYQADKSFTTASTYKLFVAYSTIKRVDKGTWKWSDAKIVGNKSRSECFDDMIIKSDNPCAEALLDGIGYKPITKEIQKLGLKNTSFLLGDTPHSTAADETLFLKKLATNKLSISRNGHNRLLSAMKKQVYRQGIPAGASGQTADKVGFLWGLLHDAAIVYSPKGTYVLTIMSDKSSWANIAALTKEIEALR